MADKRLLEVEIWQARTASPLGASAGAFKATRPWSYRGSALRMVDIVIRDPQAAARPLGRISGANRLTKRKGDSPRMSGSGRDGESSATWAPDGVKHEKNILLPQVPVADWGEIFLDQQVKRRPSPT